jgi:hypothetical protein
LSSAAVARIFRMTEYSGTWRNIIFYFENALELLSEFSCLPSRFNRHKIYCSKQILLFVSPDWIPSLSSMIAMASFSVSRASYSSYPVEFSSLFLKQHRWPSHRQFQHLWTYSPGTGLVFLKIWGIVRTWPSSAVRLFMCELMCVVKLDVIQS